ncbi:hypothetical protein [Streptomyces canus]|uniref:hypothetical protein n=1 Tax=Streptomyces canus TaxID=58343 RepID=UPI00324F4A0F
MPIAATVGGSSPQPVPHSRNAGSRSTYPEWASERVSSASPDAATSSPAAAGSRGPNRLVMRPPTGAMTASGANRGTTVRPASRAGRCCTDWRNSISTNSVPRVHRFMIPAVVLAAVKAGRRRSVGGSIASSPRRSSAVASTA